MEKTIIKESTKFFRHQREMYKFADMMRNSRKYKVITLGSVNSSLYYVKYKTREV